MKAKTNKNNKTINILGTNYSVFIDDYDQNPTFETMGVVGYCEMMTHTIHLCDLSTCPGYEFEASTFLDSASKEIFRHEIVHAFLFESGLSNSAHSTQSGWATDEEIIDWIALQSPKLFKLFSELDLLD